MSESTDTAVLGGGCFWCLEAVFHELDGVQEVVSGYAGGERPNPTYEQVCSGATGHAEVVQIRFHPDRIDYPTLLEVFFAIHDPTQLNRQGNDVGPQYRSVIFPRDEAQRAAAEAAIRDVAGRTAAPVVTTIESGPFYPAEDHHQLFYARNAGQPYCQVMIEPKLAKVRQHFRERVK